MDFLSQPGWLPALSRRWWRQQFILDKESLKKGPTWRYFYRMETRLKAEDHFLAINRAITNSNQLIRRAHTHVNTSTCALQHVHAPMRGGEKERGPTRTHARGKSGCVRVDMFSFGHLVLHRTVTWRVVIPSPVTQPGRNTPLLGFHFHPSPIPEKGKRKAAIPRTILQACTPLITWEGMK